MPAHVRRDPARTQSARGQRLVRDQLADVEADARVRRAEHLTRQQQRRERLGQHRDAVEDRRILRRDVYRQHRRRGLHRKPREAGRPSGVAHAERTHARDFA